MVRLEQAIIMDREAQTSDTAVFRKNLPKAGSYSAIDIGIRITNGSTSAQGIDLLDALKHISLVMNGNDYRIHLSGHEFFRYQWMKHGKPMFYTWTQSASGVQEVWFRMDFGRFLGDREFGLDLSRFNNVQVQIDYDCTLMGAAAVTTWTSGTFAISIIAHQFPVGSRPAFRGMVGTREFYSGTTLASGDLVQDLPSANPIVALGVMCIEDAVADAVDITDIKVGNNSFASLWIDGKWYNFQRMQNHELTVREEIFKLFADDAQTTDSHMNNIRSATAKCRAMTTAIA